MAKRILNIKDSKKAIGYANIFIERIPKESKRILVYGIADIRALEEILGAFPDKEFTIVEQINIVNLLKKIYTSDRYTFVEAEYDSADLALFNENGEIWKMSKFDCAIMNPPYDKNLHLQILQEVLSHVDKVVNISPIRWLQDPFAARKRSELKRFEAGICKKLSTVEVIERDIGNKMFGIGSFSDLGIYVSGSGFDYHNFWMLSRSNNEISILEKVCLGQTRCTLAEMVSKQDCSTGIHVLISCIAGGRGNKPIYKYDGIVQDGQVGGEDFLSVWNRNPKHTAWQKDDMVMDSVLFDTMEEATNFYDSYSTKFFTYLCEITVQQQHIQNQELPFMPTYTHPWTDKDLCKFFNITGYISDTEAEPGSEWETILHAQ